MVLKENRWLITQRFYLGRRVMWSCLSFWGEEGTRVPEWFYADNKNAQEDARRRMRSP
jgi:hypothetical protein